MVSELPTSGSACEECNSVVVRDITTMLDTFQIRFRSFVDARRTYVTHFPAIPPVSADWNVNSAQHLFARKPTPYA